MFLLADRFRASDKGQRRKNEHGRGEEARPTHRQGSRARSRDGQSPSIWPAAKAPVMAAIRRGADLPPMRRASSIPAMVITMNVPPTHTAEMTIAGRLTSIAGIITPAAMTICPSAQERRGVKFRRTAATTTVEIAAARPNTGHVQPNTPQDYLSERGRRPAMPEASVQISWIVLCSYGPALRLQRPGRVPNRLLSSFAQGVYRDRQ